MLKRLFDRFRKKPDLFLTAEDHALLWELAMTGARIIPFGSRVVCNPPPTTSDFDYAVLATDEVVKMLRHNGFDTNGNRYQGPFFSYRRGALNLLLVETMDYLNSIAVANEECRRHNYRKKADRIAVFKRIVYPGFTS